MSNIISKTFTVLLFLVLSSAIASATPKNIQVFGSLVNQQGIIYLVEELTYNKYKLTSDLQKYNKMTADCISKNINSDTMVTIIGITDDSKTITDGNTYCTTAVYSKELVDSFDNSFMRIPWGSDLSVFIEKGFKCSMDEQYCTDSGSNALSRRLEVTDIEYLFDTNGKFTAVNVYNSKSVKFISHLEKSLGLEPNYTNIDFENDSLSVLSEYNGDNMITTIVKK